MAEIYRYKGKLYVIRQPGTHGADFARNEELVFLIGKNGSERPVNWRGDVIRTLGQGVTGWKGEIDSPVAPRRFNDRKLASVG